MQHSSQQFSIRFPGEGWNPCLFLSVFIGFVICACSGYSATGGPGPLVRDSLSTWASDKSKPLTTNLIVIMPLEAGSSLARSAEGLGERRLLRLTQKLVNAFEIGTSLEIVNSIDRKGTEQVVAELSRVQATPQKRAALLGEKLAAQGVLYGVVNRYQDEKSTRLGANVPPSVGFKLWLLDTDRKEVVWSATYEKRQEPLSDNIFRVPEALKSGVGYRSSEELITEGFAGAAQALEALRGEKLQGS